MSALATQAQVKPSGIYLPVKCASLVTSYPLILTGKPVCVTALPIIPVTEFEAVSKMGSMRSVIYFDITLSGKGFDTLVQLRNSFPALEVVLMVDGEAFMLMNLGQSQITRVFRFQGVYADFSKFKTVQQKLEREVKAMKAGN
ncbi:MAG: hypothetical protein ACOYXA_13395 [Bacteroidota bacterium]